MILFGAGARTFRLLVCLMTLGGSCTSGASPVRGDTLQVRVTPVAGEPYRAELQDITEDSLTLLADGVERTVATSDVSRIERAEPAELRSPPISVGLSDGSRLKCEAVLIDGGEATIQLRGDDRIQLPLERVQWVRFRPPSAAVDDAWLGMLGDEQPNDVLVIRRSSDTIDQVSGIVLGADETTVRFNVGEQEVPAPVARLEGIVFGSTEGSDEGAIVVGDVLGSQWSVASLEMTDAAAGALQMELASGLERSMPLEQLGSIRFEGNVHLLAIETPVEAHYTPLIQLPLPEERLLRWLGPHAAEDRDVVLRSRSSVTYRVDPKFRTFTARIVPDQRVAAGGGCEVRILVDGQVAWSETVLPADDPRGVELDLGEAKRITLEVDYGDDQAKSDVGDVVRFIQPRLLQ